MKDYQQRWNQCLRLIRENIGKTGKNIPADECEWVFNTWFMPVKFESYDPATRKLVLRIPDNHVADYIEHYYFRFWSWALRSTFGDGVILGYRVIAPAPDMPDSFLTSSVSPTRLQFAVPGARERMEQELRSVVGNGFQWLPPYDDIAAWLSDNRGRGLLFVGTPGIGKSTICREVLPAIIGGRDREKIPVVRAQDMRQRIDELLHARCVVIDDLGKDERLHFGNTDNSFFDLCEASVQGGPLLIISTNLSTSPVNPEWRTVYPLSIEERYGPEVLGRLKAITKLVDYNGESLWK